MNLKKILFLKKIISMNLKSYSITLSSLFFLVNVSAQINFDNSFSPDTPYKVLAVQIADMNNDGRNDIIEIRESSPFDPNTQKIFIFYQDEMGGLIEPPFELNHSGYGGAAGIQIFDMDNNGFKDIIIAGDDAIDIAYQNNLGEFNFDSLPTGDYIVPAFSVGDLNNDNLLDIVYYNNSNDAYGVFYQQANPVSVFENVLYPTNIQSIEWATHYDIADMNNDGLNDLVLGASFFLDSFFVFLQADTGLVNNPIGYEVDNYFNAYALGDINNDGFTDLVGNNGKVWINNPNTATLEQQYTVSTGGNSVGLYDLNCDGYLDLLFTPNGGSGVRIYSGSEYGFSAYESFNIGFSYTNYKALGIGDINSDNLPDICVAKSGGDNGLPILYNTSQPSNSDYQIIDTLIFQNILGDTILEEYLWVQQVFDSTGNCTLIQTDSFLISNEIIDTEIFTESTYYLEAELCGNLFNDSIVVPSYNNPPPGEIIDTLLVYSTLDTLSTVNLISENIVIDTLPAYFLSVDSTIHLSQTIEESSDTVFIIIDSFWLVNIYEISNFETTTTSINEVTECGLTFIDTLVQTDLQEITNFSYVDSVLISQTIYIEILSNTKELNSSSERLTTFPNPTNDFVNIVIPPNLNEKKLDVSLINITSQYIYKSSKLDFITPNLLQINLSHLPPSSYILRLENEAGRSYFGKIILIK